MEHVHLLTHPFGEKETVELTSDEALTALIHQRIYYCEYCSLEISTRVFHLVGDPDDLSTWDHSVNSIKKG